MFHANTTGDPRSFMCYKGDYYINGTEVTLKDTYMNGHQFYGKPLWKYARFDHQTVYNNQIAYFFCATKIDWLSLKEMGLDPKLRREYAPYFVVTAIELENAIESITKPIKLTKEETAAINSSITSPKRDWDDNGLILLWTIYIIVMIGSLIFKQFYIIWIIASCVFFKYRNKILN